MHFVSVRVDSGRQVRVGDFGLARVVDGICYRQKRSICMPFMWMSIESLLERTFSTSSDVVSVFGLSVCPSISVAILWYCVVF